MEVPHKVLYKIFTALAVAFFLAGCASQILESYVGKSIQEPILDYGPPTNIVELEDGRRAYQWRIDSSGYIPISTPTIATSSGPYGVTTTTVNSSTLVPFSEQCLYTLTATEKGSRWIVDGFRKPSFACE